MPVLIGGSCVFLLVLVIAAVVTNFPSRNSGSSSSASSASSTTPLGCEVPDTSVNGSSDRWINCTEREVARRLCGQDVTYLERYHNPDPVDPNAPYAITDYPDPNGTPIQFYYQLNPPGPKSVACSTGTHTISSSDWQKLSRPGSPNDLPPSLR